MSPRVRPPRKMGETRLGAGRAGAAPSGRGPVLPQAFTEVPPQSLTQAPGRSHEVPGPTRSECSASVLTRLRGGSK